MPHTVRGGRPPRPTDRQRPRPRPEAYLPGHYETKTCTDCHLSKNDDNNAIMAQLLMQGTNYVNFIGRYCWVAAGEHGLAAVVVTERDEPQAVIGSSLHQLAYPDDFRKHVERGGKLEHAHEHSGRDISERSASARKPEILSTSRRAASTCTPPAARPACASSTSPSSTTRASPSGSSRRRSRRWASGSTCRTKYATAVAAPTTIAPDPTRTHQPENHEQTVHAHVRLPLRDRPVTRA